MRSPLESHVSSRKHAGIPTAVGRIPRASLIIAASPSISVASTGSAAILFAMLIAARWMASDGAGVDETISR
jgi:hypothetical protein